MTFTDLITALVITTLFLNGFGQAVMPALRAWRGANEEYQVAQDIAFVAESFRKECTQDDRSIERWKRAVASVRELQAVEITEYTEEGYLLALKLSCVVAGEAIEVIGVCTP
jgi:hypothetical protein